MWRKRNPCAVLDCKLVEHCGEQCMEVPQKIKQKLHMIQQFHFWIFIPIKQNHLLKIFGHPCVHCSIIYNSQDMEGSMWKQPCSFMDEWMKKYYEIYDDDRYRQQVNKQIDSQWNIVQPIFYSSHFHRGAVTAFYGCTL